MAPVAAVGLEDPESRNYFSTDDPETLFEDLREIGHGSFGAVYYAKDVASKSIVAIKQMSYSGSGKKSLEKWQDIMREVKILGELRHEHTISYEGCYLKERQQTAWLVMEYCLGSASDIVEVHKSPLKEEEISAICRDCLLGLDYLHSRQFIHRDVKAGNILFTDSGVVKLADFGSASVVSPANSFVGTPYWMSPEVILAMDEGQYGGNSDIWSLGITCIELAEGKPPLFNMNAMAALYHIPQNDPPTLSSLTWSQDFVTFLEQSLLKNVKLRPQASDQLKHVFIDKYTSRSQEILLDLVRRTKDAVREMDKRNARKIKKFLMTETFGESNDSRSSSSTEDVTCVDDSSQDEISIGGDSVSSRDNGDATDLRVATGSQNDLVKIFQKPPDNRRHFNNGDHLPRSSSNGRISLQASLSCDSSRSSISRHDSGGSDSSAHQQSANNFATIRTPSIVKKQKVEHAQDDLFKEQMSVYKRMRRQHQKKIQQLEEKSQIDLDILDSKLIKEREVLINNFYKDLEKLKRTQQQDRDKTLQSAQADEDHLLKHIKKQQKNEMETFRKDQLKQKKLKTDEMKQSHKTTPKKEKEETLRHHKEAMDGEVEKSIETKEREHRRRKEVQLRRFKRQKLSGLHQLEQRWFREELNRKEAQNESIHAMDRRHHEQKQDLEYKELSEIHKMRDDHLKKQHSTELQNQKEYSERQEKELRKRHALQTRQLPRSLQDNVLKIRKQLKEALQTQDNQYKARKAAELSQAPKAEHRAIKQRLKEEQIYKSTELYNTYEQIINDNREKQNVTLDGSQLSEYQELKRKLEEEMELLMAYQSKIRMQMDGLHTRERKELQDKVSLRRATLEAKIEEDLQKFNSDRASSQRKQHDAQNKEIELFDREASDLGIDPQEIRYSDDEHFRRIMNEEQCSVAGLSISSSTPSFSTQL